MAATTETSQYERDLRSSKTEWKRTKDSAAKWSHGNRPLPGVRLGVYGDGDSEQTKSRPGKKYSDYHRPIQRHTPNTVKLRPNWLVPAARMRSKIHAESEIRDAASLDNTPPLLSPASPNLRRTLSLSSSAADFPTLSGSGGNGSAAYYSFDRADSPGRPLTLEVFVKKPTGRETERLVEREYEVLDGNGEAVKGRKARAVLRRNDKEREGSGGGGGGVKEEKEDEAEDEGFELV